MGRLIDTDDLVTVADVAARMRVTSAAVSNWRHRWGDFPDPVARAVYDWQEVKVWARAHNLELPEDRRAAAEKYLSGSWR